MIHGWRGHSGVGRWRAAERVIQRSDVSGASYTMRVPRVRFTVRRLMTGIAVCAVSLAVLREAPMIAILIGPLIGSLWEMRRGGTGLTGSSIGGVIPMVGISLIGFIEWYSRMTDRSLSDILLFIAICGLYTLGGAVFGLAEGMAIRYLRYLATLPRRLRLRAERSARANAYRPRSQAG
jgi:hypothetical protein